METFNNRQDEANEELDRRLDAGEKMAEVVPPGYDEDRCTGTSDGLDQNTLDRTAPREDGHRFLLETRYRDGHHDATCLKCGLRVEIEKDGTVIDE